MKVVVIGGVAAGASCAARIRRLNEDIEIVIFEKSKHISYANCGLPYYLGDVITEERNLTLQTPESFKRRFNINSYVSHEVLKIDREGKRVLVKNLETNEEFYESYDKLVISTGAKPVIPPIKGIDSKKIFTLRNVTDVKNIYNFINRDEVKSALVIGAGFIGLEVAENLAHVGIKTTIIEGAKQIMNTMDPDFANVLEKELKRNGVSVHTDELVNEFIEGDKITAVTNKNSYEADVVILAIGVAPDSKLASEAGLEMGVRNSIKVNEYLETSDKDIYAGGDAVEILNHETNNLGLISLAGPANKQGRAIADNICGLKTKYKGAIPTSILKLFDLTASSTGLNIKEATRLGYNFDYVISSPNTNASYYPDFEVLLMKVLFEKETGRILGGQVIGKKSVDKPIDTLSTIINFKGTYKDLIDLDLAYAPAYSSAKNPLNMVGYMIENVVNGLVKQASFDDEYEGLNLDVSTPYEFKIRSLKKAINIPIDELRERAKELPKGQPIYINCFSGLRSYLACRILNQLGYDCYNLRGGLRYYVATH